VKTFFSPKDVREIADVSYRQIQYWDKSNFISPSYRRKGKYRLYTFSDLLQIKIVETLRRNGYSVQQLRRTIGTLRLMLKKVSFPFTDVKILFEKNRILLFNGDVYMSKENEKAIYFSADTLKDKINETQGTED